MLTQDKASCQAKCDDGWTSNGDPEKLCVRCSSSCQTCADNGNKGDNEICLTCGN